MRRRARANPVPFFFGRELTSLSPCQVNGSSRRTHIVSSVACIYDASRVAALPRKFLNLRALPQDQLATPVLCRRYTVQSRGRPITGFRMVAGVRNTVAAPPEVAR
jgi:hypothetical protein